MHIGTPLSPSATKVLLLGAGELGKELVISLQRLGVEVTAVDRYANAPGHQVAHRAHVVAMTDGAALRRLIEQERPHLVVPELEAIAAEALVAAEREGIARVAPSAQAVALTASREALRRLAERLGLPMSPYRFADGVDELTRAIEATPGIGYPCVVKPAMSSSGKGQTVVRSRGDIAHAWQYAESAARVRGSRTIVEGFVEFDCEVTLLTVRAADEGGAVRTHFCAPIGHLQVQGDYVESWQPQPMSAAALTAAHDIAGRVAAELGGCGVFAVELFVKGDRVWFSEASPRPSDTGMVTLCTQAQSEFDLHARAILGLPVDAKLVAPGASAVVYGGVDGRGIRFEDVAQALAVPCSDLRLFGKPEAYKRRRMGVALATGADVAQARERAKACASRVKPRA